MITGNVYVVTSSLEEFEHFHQLQMSFHTASFSAWKPFWSWGNWSSPMSYHGVTDNVKEINSNLTSFPTPASAPNPLLPQEKQSLWPTKDLGLPAWLTRSPGAHTRFLIRGSQSVLRLFIMSHAGNQAAPFFFFFPLPCQGWARIRGRYTAIQAQSSLKCPVTQWGPLLVETGRATWWSGGLPFSSHFKARP